ncbi:hypothetical protein PPBDW_II0160 [Photobacterium kishitanii]|nr:hypothetical protein PPBDW_II0160 [Photobacterium kishitanii]
MYPTLKAIASFLQLKSKNHTNFIKRQHCRHLTLKYKHLFIRDKEVKKLVLQNVSDINQVKKTTQLIFSLILLQTNLKQFNFN